MPVASPRVSYRCEVCGIPQKSYSHLGHIRIFIAPCRLQDDGYVYEANACPKCRQTLTRAFQRELALIDDDC